MITEDFYQDPEHLVPFGPARRRQHSIDPDDIIVEVIKHQAIPLDVYPHGSEQIKITHIPSGLSVTVSHRSQLQAKILALAELQAKLNQASSQLNTE